MLMLSQKGGIYQKVEITTDPQSMYIQFAYQKCIKIICISKVNVVLDKASSDILAAGCECPAARLLQQVVSMSVHYATH